MEESKKIKIRIKAALFLITALAGASFFVFSFSAFKNAALALGDYNKIPPATLKLTDWNNLDDDFLAKSGGTMAGTLNMNNYSITNLPTPTSANTNYAATVEYVNNVSGASARDSSGTAMKVICDSTPPSTDWTDVIGDIISTYVDTTGASGFTATPYYLTSISGAGRAWDQYGGVIYSPTMSGFTLQVKTWDGHDAAYAESYDWYVNWCGIGI